MHACRSTLEDPTIPLTLAAPASADPALAAETNLIRVRAVDQAGNLSPESAVRIVVDDQPPAAPALAAVPSPTNADTVSLNFLTTNLADDDATFDHYVIQSTLLPAPFDSFQLDGIIVTLLPEAVNTLTVRAVDRAGNASPPVSVVARQDSVVPAAPSITPLVGTARGGPVEISLVTPSLDVFDGTDDGVTNPTAAPVTRYQLKDGLGEGFKNVAGDGPFLAALRPGRDNEVCLRGVDGAGNVSIEECAVFTEASRTLIAGVVDHPSGADLFGDFYVFGSSGRVVLRDLRGILADVVLTPGQPAFNPRGAVHASGDVGHVVAVWESDSGRSSIAQVDFTTLQPGGAPTVTIGQFFGVQPHVDGDVVVYWNNGRVRQRSTAVPVDLFAGGAFDPDPTDLGADISGHDVALCTFTGPRVGGGVVVWCEEVLGVGLLARHVVGDAANAQNRVLAPGVAAVKAGTLIPVPPLSRQQPLVDRDVIAWASADPVFGAELLFIELRGDPLATTISGTGHFGVDFMSDLDGFNLVTLQVRADGLLNDVQAVRIGAAPVVIAATDDIPPQFEGVLDGTRLIFRDGGIGDGAVLADLSATRWIQGSSALVFEPTTSAAVTAWVQNVGNQIRLGARRLPIDREPLLLVDAAAASVAFFGPSKADPTYAAGGARVAYATGVVPPFTLKLHDMVTDQVVTLTTAAAGPFAIDPDGDDLVFVEAGTGALKDVPLPAALPGTFTATTVALAGAGPVVMLDLDDGVVVAQRGGNPQRDAFAESAGQIVCAQAGATGVVPVPVGRGPKVAHIGPAQFLAAVADGGTRASGCLLTCTAAPACAPFAAGVGPGIDTHVQVSRDGRIAYLNDESGINQAVLFDVGARRRTFVTTGDVERSSVSLATGRLVYSDSSLGGRGIFEVTLP